MSTRRAKKHRAIPAKVSAPVTVAEVEKRQGPFGTSEAAALLSMMLGQELEQLTTARKKLTATQRQTQIRRCVATLAELGELTGDSKQMPESKVVRLPAFKRVAAEIAAVLASRWPDAAAAVADALAQYERGERPAERNGTT